MKHAFLILAHKNYAQLDKLIGLLDSERTDIFIQPRLYRGIFNRLLKDYIVPFNQRTLNRMPV